MLVLDYLLESIERSPNHCAIVEGESQFTFLQLAATGHSIANTIESRIANTKRPIAIFLPKCYDCIASFMGVMLSGNIYVPLDVNSPVERVRSILKNLDPELVITSNEFLEPLIKAGADMSRIIALDNVSQLNSSDVSREVLEKHRFTALIDSDPAYIIYTSGSTGIPKGVVISHRSILNYIEWARNTFKLDPGTVIGSQAPFYFDNSTLDIYLCLSECATLVLIPEKCYIFPPQLLEFINKHKVNFVFWVPSVLVLVANLDLLKEIKLPHLKNILFAGEVIPTRQLNYWITHHPNAIYANLYGPTEITVDCTYYIIPGVLDETKSVPIGFPCQNTDILVLNESNLPCQSGEIGELCVRGTSLALGYWNDFEKTNEVFVQNPLNEYFPELIYRTGDLVYRNNDDPINFVGRKDQQIKHLGYRIELAEIELAVSTMPGINNACVLYNNKRRRIVLIYEALEELKPENIRANLLQYLPKYMMPSDFHRIDCFPRNSNGKIDRKILSKIY